MEALQSSTPAPSRQPGSQTPSQTSAKTPSQVTPQVHSPVHSHHNPTTHYPNGLPRSINGLKGSTANGAGSASPSPATVSGTPRENTPRENTPRETAAHSPVMLSATAAKTTGNATLTPTPAPARPPPPPSAAAPAPMLAPAPMKPMVIYTPTQPSQSLPRQPSQRQSSSGKIAIVDPPGMQPARPRIHSHPQNSQGFPSPRREHQIDNPKFMDDLSRLTHAMQQSVPSAARRVIRDNWEKCLLGSEFHHAFLLNAVIHHSSGVIIRRSIKDFGARMVAESKREIVEHLSTSDLNEVADAILEKVDDKFLDKALERRLKTIDAHSLINALARAERLGYEDNDIVDDRGAPRFNPAPVPFNPSPNLQPGPPKHVQRAPPRAPIPIVQCPLCWRKFDNPQPYEYHIQKQVCTKEPPNNEGFAFSCKHCGAGFVTKVGRDYHTGNNVCGDHGAAGATPIGGSPITLSSGNNSPVQLPSSVAPYPPGSRQQGPAATPVQRRVSMAPTPASKDGDPYSHLNPDTLKRLKDELQQAEASYTDRFKAAEAIEDPTLKQARLDGLQNSFSTKQSIIRKKYGVRLRNRRTKAEIDTERQRMGWKHASPDQPEGTPSAKRQRIDDDQPPSMNPQANGEPKINHISVADMKTGLSGSNATAATADPTRPKSPVPVKSHTPPNPSTEPQSTVSQQSTPAQNSLSSLQRKGYRVSSHHRLPGEAATANATIEGQNAKQSGSASSPMVLDDESSSDSDSDGEIPAHLPPRKADDTPSRLAS